ncbi:MAG: CBS domain-containing protein [Phycisphaerales bacterium]
MNTIAQLLAEKRRWAQQNAGLDRFEDLHTIDEKKTVLDAAELMNDHRIGALVVLDDEKQPVGIITERDILRRVVAMGRPPSKTSVSKVMTTEMLYCLPDCTLEQARQLMMQRKIRHIPVIEGPGGAQQLLGMISIGDLNAAANEDLSIEVKSMREYITHG